VSAVLEIPLKDELETWLDAAIVGKTIARYRKKKNMTQVVLSDFAVIQRTHLSAIERGARKPTLETLYRISQALQIKMSEIVASIEEEMKNAPPQGEGVKHFE